MVYINIHTSPPVDRAREEACPQTMEEHTTLPAGEQRILEPLWGKRRGMGGGGEGGEEGGGGEGRRNEGGEGDGGRVGEGGGGGERLYVFQKN